MKKLTFVALAALGLNALAGNNISAQLESKLFSVCDSIAARKVSCTGTVPDAADNGDAAIVHYLTKAIAGDLAGFDVAVNESAREDRTVRMGERTFVLPPKGWVVQSADGRTGSLNVRLNRQRFMAGWCDDYVVWVKDGQIGQRRLNQTRGVSVRAVRDARVPRKLGEESEFRVTVRDSAGKLCTKGTVVVSADNCGMRNLLPEKRFDLSAGNPFTVRAKMSEPGFLRLRARQVETGKTVTETVPYEPSAIRPGTKLPADFDAVWKADLAKAEATVPLDPRLEEVKEGHYGGALREYSVSFATTQGRRANGYLTIPKTASAQNRMGVVVTVVGAGSGATYAWDARDDSITLVLNIVDYLPTEANAGRDYAKMNAEAKAKYGASSYALAGWAASREEVFFHSQLIGLVRGLKWVAQLPEVDANDFSYFGGSQGGGCGYAVVALSGGLFRRAFFYITAMSDMLRADVGGVDGWPCVRGAKYDAAGLAAVLKNTPYFDSCSFAHLIRCPVRSTLGLEDVTCAPPNVMASFNMLNSADRRIDFEPAVGHGITAQRFASIYEWLRAPDAAPAPAGETRVFEDGTHYLTETKVFTAADSGTVWKAAPGAKPVISGARKVTGWKKAENGLWVADVPWVTSRERGFRQLVVNGAARPRARHPNKGYFRSLNTPRPKDVTWHQWEYSLEKPRFAIKPGEVDPKWDLASGEVIFYHIWVDSHCIPKSLAVEQGTNWLNLAVNVRRNPCNSKWRLENLKEIADEPGEWALDYAAKKVWYRPVADEDPSKAEIVVPDVETLVRIEGAKNLRFEGLTFADSRFELKKGDRNDVQASCSVSAALVLSNAENCVFESCRFTRLSGYALDFMAGTRDCRVTKCDLVRLGAGGVRLNSFPRGSRLTTTNGVTRYQMPDPRTLVSGNEITDCEIADFGRDFPSAVGVLCMAAEGTKIQHNSIHDGYYTGVSVGWEWGYMPSVSRDNLIEHNHIYNIGKGLLSDMGGIYTLGVAPGTKLRYNLIHDVDAEYYGGWGIYPDEGSSGLLIENNIVYNTKFAPFHQHFGRNNTVRNNIFAGGRIDQLACSRWEPHTRLFFYNNIVYWQQGQLHTGRWEDKDPYVFTRVPRELRANNTMKLIKTSECDYNLYFNPKLALKDVKWGTQKCTWDAWRAKYFQDAHSAWGDPLFVDAAKHDYRLKPGSPALKLGFRPIDMTGVGPRRTR